MTRIALAQQARAPSARWPPPRAAAQSRSGAAAAATGRNVPRPAPEASRYRTPRSAWSASGTSTACRRSPTKRLDRPLVARIGLHGIGHHPQHLEAFGPRQQGAHALVEGGVAGHDLLERGQPAQEAVALALQRLDLAGQGQGVGLGFGRARRRRPRARPRAGPGGLRLLRRGPARRRAAPRRAGAPSPARLPPPRA